MPLILILSALGVLLGLFWVGYMIYAERRFERRYAEFKRQQRINRARFFASLNDQD